MPNNRRTENVGQAVENSQIMESTRETKVVKSNYSSASQKESKQAWSRQGEARLREDWKYKTTFNDHRR